MYVDQPSMFWDTVYDYQQHPVIIKAARLIVIVSQPQSSKQ